MKIRLTDGSGTIELKYLVEDVDRYGKARIYFRRKGQRKVPLRAPVGSTEFLQEYRDALAGKIKPKADTKRVPSPTGSLRALIEQYCEKSAEFKTLDERTQYVRRGILDTICLEPTSDDDPSPIGSMPFASTPTKALRALRDRKAETPEQANAWIKALRQVFKYAKANELVEHNPASDVPYIKTGSAGFHTWTVEEVRQFEARFPIGTKARLALGLLFSARAGPTLHSLAVSISAMPSMSRKNFALFILAAGCDTHSTRTANESRYHSKYQYSLSSRQSLLHRPSVTLRS